MTNSQAESGLALVHTGDGRGKATSAFGAILLMLGRKKRVALIQFLNHEAGQWGEVRALCQLGLAPIRPTGQPVVYLLLFEKPGGSREEKACYFA